MENVKQEGLNSLIWTSKCQMLYYIAYLFMRFSKIMGIPRISGGLLPTTKRATIENSSKMTSERRNCQEHKKSQDNLN